MIRLELFAYTIVLLIPFTVQYALHHSLSIVQPLATKQRITSRIARTILMCIAGVYNADESVLQDGMRVYKMNA